MADGRQAPGGRAARDGAAGPGRARAQGQGRAARIGGAGAGGGAGRARPRRPPTPPTAWARLRASAAAHPGAVRRGGLAAALCALWALGGCGGALTGEVGRACLQAGRSAASLALCSCVQRAADQTLSAQDQARAAEFFGDPQEAQDVRQSDARRDEAFWTRYRAFADRAEAICG